MYSSSSPTPLTHGTDDGRDALNASGIDGIHSPKMSVSFLLAARLISAKALLLMARLTPLFTPRNPTAMLGNPHSLPVFKPSQPDRKLDEVISQKATTRLVVGFETGQTSTSHVFLKWSVTIVLPDPNWVNSPVVSATCVLIMSRTSLRTGIYWM